MLADARATAAGADIVEAGLDMLYMHQVAVESEQGQSDADQIRKTEIKLQEQSTIDFEIDEVLSIRAGIELPVILTCRPSRQSYFQVPRRRGVTY